MDKRSITALVCGDPPAGRSALDGWKQIGTHDVTHRLYDDDDKRRRKADCQKIRAKRRNQN